MWVWWVFSISRWTICQYWVCVPSSPKHDLTAPTATSVDMEHVFSKGRLVLSHVQNGLSVQSMCTVMCLSAWSRMGLVKDKDVMQAVRLPNVDGNEADLDSDWDDILVVQIWNLLQSTMWTHRANLHGFLYLCYPPVPIPTLHCTDTHEHGYRFHEGTGMGRGQVTHGLPVTCTTGHAAYQHFQGS